MALSDRVIAAYQDGMRIIAYKGAFGDVGYAITGQVGSGNAEADIILDEREARELAAALTWVISEADRKTGKASFRPPAKRGTSGKGA